MGVTRGASPALLAQLSGHFHPVVLTRAEWPSETEHFHSGFGDLAWDGQTWMGLGPLVSYEITGEGLGGDAQAGLVRVAATLEAALEMLAVNIRNCAVEVYWGAVTEPGGNTLAADPVSLFLGYFDSRKLVLSRVGDELSHDLELGVAIGPSPRAGATITHGPEDQQRAFPGDTAGRHVIHALKTALNPPTWPET